MVTSSLYVEKISSVMICGSDAGDFLHRLTTQDFRAFKEGEKRHGALLNSTSHIQHLFTAQFKEGCFILSTDSTRASRLAQDLEKMHFAEDLKIEVLPGFEENAKLSEEERLSQGLFKFGVDITEKNLILEAPLNSYLHRNKGCYPGQEVVERIFTYGQVAKKLVGVRLSKNVSAGEDLTVQGKKVGTVTSATESVALAMIQKPHYQEKTSLDQGEVFLLTDSF